jgi:hypothetical protein
VTREYSYAVGGGLNTLHWTQHCAPSWEAFVEWLGLDDPADHKACGGYVAAELQETTGHLKKPDCVGLHRNKKAIVSRSMATLDVDYAGLSFVADAYLTLDCAMAMYTTWSHTPEKPRWRLIVPLSEDVKPEDYRLIIDALMLELGQEQFDNGSREPERLMHRPSTQGSYRAHVFEGEPLDVQAWLGRARALGLEEKLKQPVVYSGDDQYATMTVDQQRAADELVQERAELWRKAWAEAELWDEDHRDERGRGWEALARDCAWAFAKLAATPWTSLDEDGADLLYHDVVPDVVRDALPADKWHAGLVAKAADGPVDPTGSTTTSRGTSPATSSSASGWPGSTSLAGTSPGGRRAGRCGTASAGTSTSRTTASTGTCARRCSTSARTRSRRPTAGATAPSRLPARTPRRRRRR